MPIEVELKARVQDADALLRRLRDKSDGQPSTYRDTYYDWPDRRLGNDFFRLPRPRDAAASARAARADERVDRDDRSDGSAAADTEPDRFSR